MPIALEPFDLSRDFVAQTNFRAGGVIWMRKKPFDKSYVNDRVLRQLYEARKIAYAPPVALEDTKGASGKARKAPGAEESTSAQSGPASAPNETAKDAEEDTAEPSEAEAAAAPVGGAATAAAETVDRETLIKRLVKAHNHDTLFAKASGLAGVTKTQTKAEIAAALVDAGRVGDGSA
jgi:hypothetical protein